MNNMTNVAVVRKLAAVVAKFERDMNSNPNKARTRWVRCRTSFERCCQVELGWRFRQALNAGNAGAYEVKLDKAADGYKGRADFVINARGAPVAVLEMKGAFACEAHFQRCTGPRPSRKDLEYAFATWGGRGKGMVKDVERLRKASPGWARGVIVLAIGAPLAGEPGSDPCKKCGPASGCERIDDFAGALRKILEWQDMQTVTTRSAASRSDDPLRLMLFKLPASSARR